MNENRLSQLKAMQAAEPDDPFLAYAIAQEYLGDGQYALARTLFEELLNQHPTYLAAYHHYGITCIHLGDAVAAEKALREGIALAKSENKSKAASEMAELLDDLLDQ